VSLGSYNNDRNAFVFRVGPSGSRVDGVLSNGTNNDPSWDGVWTVETRIDSLGWTTELRIPLSQLRYATVPPDTTAQWGINFRRDIARYSESVTWAPLDPTVDRTVSLFGSLRNLRDLPSPRRLEVEPYMAGRMARPADGNALQSPTEWTGRVGGDVQYGLTPSTTLQATINPDFGQVEADPSQINLSAFETFFAEKRSFFIQGTDIFDFSLGRRADLLYTRRIGASLPVIGALKLTGRTEGNLVYGAMAATTGDSFSPTRNYGVGRLRQDFGRQSSVGGMVTGFDAPVSDASGRQRSLAGGLDWDLRFADNNYQFQGYTSGTHRRPDSDGPQTGFAMNAEVGRVRGAWTYDAEVTLRDDAFDPNDVGRMRESNFVRVNGGFRHQFNDGQPFGAFQRGSGFLFMGQSWSYRERLDRGLGHFSRISVLTEGFNPISFQTNTDQLFGGYNLFETRGLWPRARPRTFSTELEVRTDTRRDWTVELGVSTKQRSDGGSSWRTNVQGEWNLGSRLKLSTEVGYETEAGAVEWASNEPFKELSAGTWAFEDPSGGEFLPLSDGHDRLGDILSRVPTDPNEEGEYVVPIYGARDTDQLDLTLRSNLTLTQALSVEFFGQLFAARGRYSDFQILRDRDTLEPFEAYPKRHDFATSSFLTNAVLRWEFRPGSELFVVWSQDRLLDEDDPFLRDRRSSSPYDRSPPARLTDAFEDFPANSFIVKLRYVFY